MRKAMPNTIRPSHQRSTEKHEPPQVTPQLLEVYDRIPDVVVQCVSAYNTMFVASAYPEGENSAKY